MSEKDKLKIVYYPHLIIPSDLLKQLILYFDEVTVCLPYHFDIPDEYKYLVENKLINIYKNPALGLEKTQQQIQQEDKQENQQQIQQNIQQIQQIIQEIQQKIQKIKPGDHQKIQKMKSTIQQLCQQFQPLDHLKEIQQVFFTELLLPFDNIFNENFLITEKVAYHFGLFLDSYRSGQIPFTDNPMAQEAFRNVFNANVGKKENAVVLNEILTRNHKATYLAKEIMSEHLSSLPGFETKSFEDILELKERLKDDLDAFKKEMASLVWDIKSNPWDDGFEGEIAKTIDTKVNKNILELEKRKQKDPRISKLLKIGGPAIAGTILAMQATPHISTELALGIVGLGSGAQIIGEWLEANANKQSEYNGLNLLIELKKELR